MPYKIHASYMHSGASALGFFFSPEVQREGWPGPRMCDGCEKPRCHGLHAAPQLLGAAQELWVPRSCLLGLLG